jgi:hypothetical protein
MNLALIFFSKASQLANSKNSFRPVFHQAAVEGSCNCVPVKRIWVAISRLGDLSALVDAYIAKPSSHWLSHSSMAAGVSGPAKGGMIFDAIKRRGVAGGGRVTEGGGEGRIVRGARRRGTYGRGGAPKNGGRTSFSDSSPEESSGVLGVGGCGLLWRGTTSKGPKKGRGFAAVDCLVKRGGGVFSRVPAVGLEFYRGQMSKKKVEASCQ